MSNSSTFNNTSSIFYVDNTLSYLVDDLNLNFKHLEDPLYLASYYHLPSPLIYNEIDDFGEIHSHHDSASIQQSLKAASSAVTDDSSIFEVTNKMDSNKGEETINGVVEDGKRNNLRRSSASNGSRRRKKDRHSKINTAQGLRDRRMRLSLEVARPFFKLQDMLGYDKASRTVEWLLLHSKVAIEEVLRSLNHASPSGLTKCTISSTSDCEVESEIVEEKRNGDSKGKRSNSTSLVAKDIINPKEKRKRTTKESRMEARARARKRTLERKQSIGAKDSIWGAIEMIIEESYNDSNSQSHKDNNNLVQIGDQSPLTTFDYQQDGEISQTVPRVSMQQNYDHGRSTIIEI